MSKKKIESHHVWNEFLLQSPCWVEGTLEVVEGFLLWCVSPSRVGTNRPCGCCYDCRHKGTIQDLEHQLGCERSQHSTDKAQVDERHKAELGHACNVLAEELKQVITCATLHNKANEDIIKSLQVSTPHISTAHFVSEQLLVRVPSICSPTFDHQRSCASTCCMRVMWSLSHCSKNWSHNYL